MISKTELMQTLVEKSGISEDSLLGKIEEKQKKFPSISRDGLIYMVARDVGVDLSRPPAVDLKIKDIIPNMRNISFVGKVVELSPVRDFETERGAGKVMNAVFADETGKIRLSLWNKEIEKYNLNIGDVVRVEDCLTKTDNLGNAEARLGYRGIISKVDEDIIVAGVKNSLKDVAENDDVKVEASVLQIFTRPLVYYFCPKCRTKTIQNECQTHGEVVPDKMLIVSGIIDDGSNIIPAVFFRESAEKLIGMSVDAAEGQVRNTSLEQFISSLGIDGRRFKISGRVRRNKNSGELEVSAQAVEPA